MGLFGGDKEQRKESELPKSFNPFKDRLNSQDYDIKSREHPEDRAYRHSESLQKLNHEQRKDWYFTIVFTVLIGAVLSFGLAQCYLLLSNQRSSEEMKKVALATMSSILTGTVSGVIGYAAGKGKKSE
jgi:hypothetical protein